MALEVATNINDLVATNPGINDPASRGDDHIRLIKQVLLNDLGSLNGALTVTAAKINGMEAAYQAYADTAIDDHIFGTGNTGTVGASGVVGDYQAADTALQADIDQNASDIATLDASLTNLQNTYLANVYPVGSIYMNASNANNPSTYLGFGSWQAYGQGRVLIGAGQTSDGQETRTFTGGETGGTYKHTLNLNEIPSHRHKIPSDSADETGNGFVADSDGRGSDRTAYTDYQGGSQAHNNTQPYITVYIWRRIS